MITTHRSMLHPNVCSYEYVQCGFIPYTRSHVPIGSSLGHNYRSYLKSQAALVIVDSGYSGIVRKNRFVATLFIGLKSAIQDNIVCLQKPELLTSEAKECGSNFKLEIINHFNTPVCDLLLYNSWY